MCRKKLSTMKRKQKDMFVLMKLEQSAKKLCASLKKKKKEKSLKQTKQKHKKGAVASEGLALGAKGWGVIRGKGHGG